MVKTDIRVIYGDTDPMGFVYYANYLRFFEAGRGAYLRAKGWPYAEVEAQLQIRLPVVEAQVGYERPARYDDLLVVETTLAKVGRASARFEYSVVREGELLATGHTVHACIDFDGKVQRLPPDFVARVSK